MQWIFIYNVAMGSEWKQHAYRVRFLISTAIGSIKLFRYTVGHYRQFNWLCLTTLPNLVREIILFRCGQWLCIIMPLYDGHSGLVENIMWGNLFFSEQSRKLMNRSKIIGYNPYIMRQTACLLVNPIMVDSFALLLNCTAAVRTSDSMTASS